MKIAITGASGFIGRWAVRHLRRHHQLLLLGLEESLPELLGPSVVYEKLGRNVSHLSHSLQGCDALLHLAAVRPRRGAPFPEGANEALTAQVLTGAHGGGIRRVVFASSRLVYSPAHDTAPFQEGSAHPQTAYGRSKLGCEALLWSAQERHGIAPVVLRMGQVLGLGERGGYMDTRFRLRAAQGLPLVLWGAGRGVRHYLYVEDAVACFETALLGEVSGVFNLGMERAYSHREFAQTVNRVYQNEGNLRFDPSKEEDKARWELDLQRLKGTLGFTPQYDLEQALTQMRHMEGGAR